MKQQKIPAVFMRGGTSKAIMFLRDDLPDNQMEWKAIFQAAMGSPDPNNRQLDGMGGGISSLSKVCVIGKSARSDADIDYTFAQIAVNRDNVGYGANCGNMSSAVGPFAVDEGLVLPIGNEALVRIYNTNTDKIIHSRFPMDSDTAAVDGNFELKGVAGTGSPVCLDFIDPGGAVTGRLLPTGNVIDTIEVDSLGKVEVSLVDAANPCIFVDASVLGITGAETPMEIDSMVDVMAKLESIRAHGAVLMGLVGTTNDATQFSPSLPFVGMVAAPQDSQTLSGDRISANKADLTARIISSGNTHRALPLTGAICCACAANIENSIVHRQTRKTALEVKEKENDLRILQPSGILPVACKVVNSDSGWIVERASVYRTQRRLFEGRVLIRNSCSS